MSYILSDIKRGFKIRTIMKRNGCSATLVLACMENLDKYNMRKAA